MDNGENAHGDKGEHFSIFYLHVDKGYERFFLALQIHCNQCVVMIWSKRIKN